MPSKDKQTLARLDAGVYILYGLPGAGKSYYLACLADDYRRAGYPVACNYPIKRTHKLAPENINTDLLLSNSVLLIDEAHSIFNSRGFKNFSRQMHEFFSMHRHLGNRLVLATQHPARLDVVIREIADSFIYLSTFKIGSRPILLTARWYYEDPCRSSNVDMDRLLVPYRTERRLYSRRIMSTYDTFYVDSDAESIITAERLPLWTSRVFERVNVPPPLISQLINTAVNKVQIAHLLLHRTIVQPVYLFCAKRGRKNKHVENHSRGGLRGLPSHNPQHRRAHVLRGSNSARRSSRRRGVRSSQLGGGARDAVLVSSRARVGATPENSARENLGSRVFRAVRQRTNKIKRKILRKIEK